MFWLTTIDFVIKNKILTKKFLNLTLSKMVKSFSQNFVKYHRCGVYFMDGTLLLDGKRCGVHHKQQMLLIKLKQDHNFKRKKYFLKISKTNISSM